MNFHLSDRDRALPIYRGGQTKVLQWGVARSSGQRLPVAVWAHVNDLFAGRWCDLEAEDVVIRAHRALDNEVWFDVREVSESVCSDWATPHFTAGCLWGRRLFLREKLRENKSCRHSAHVTSQHKPHMPIPGRLELAKRQMRW
jgi:hypothetical protein